VNINSTRSRPLGSPGILTQCAGGTIVLLNLDGGQYYALDEIGGRAWELCDGRRSLAEISLVISEEYEAHPEVISGDLVALFNDLAHENLLRNNPETA
jgi:hypothetical protein